MLQQQTKSASFIPQPGFNLIDSCKFHIRTGEDAATIAFLAAKMFKDPERLQPGLYELLLNAVEHGCLGMGYELKTKLLANRTWQAEVARRQSLPDNRKKYAEVVIARKPEGIVVIVTDPGAGFDWKAWASVDPARAAETHGHGIAKARGLSFDKLTYNEKGNQAVALSKNAAEMVW